MSYSRWGRKESDMTEQHTHTQKSILIYLFEKLLSFNILPRCLGLSDTADPRRSWCSLIGAPFARAAEPLQVAWQEPEGLH